MLQRTRLFLLSLIWLFFSFWMGIYTKNTSGLGYTITDLLAFAAVYTAVRSIFPKIKRPGLLPLLLWLFSLGLMLLFRMMPQYGEIFLESYFPSRIFRGAYTTLDLRIFAVGAILYTLWEIYRRKLSRTNSQALHSPMLSSVHTEYLLLHCSVLMLTWFTPDEQLYFILKIPAIYLFVRFLCPEIEHPGLLPLSLFALMWLLSLSITVLLVGILSWTLVLYHAIGFVLVLLWELLCVYFTKRSLKHENTDLQRLAPS